jgi:hypothetical protein
MILALVAAASAATASAPANMAQSALQPWASLPGCWSGPARVAARSIPTVSCGLWRSAHDRHEVKWAQNRLCGDAHSADSSKVTFVY